jgi:hypothetical protein
MAILFSNNASTTVSGSITTGSTTVQLAAGTGAIFPHPTGGDYFVATFYDQATKTINEIVHVTNVTGDVATIVRGNSGFGVDTTTPQAWNAGDIFANLVTAGTLNAFVQAGTGPANTSLIYFGVDVSTTPNLIIATTNPVPASLVTGMFFEIKVKNTTTGTGPVNLQLNGLASIVATRVDGSSLVGNDLTGTENYIFMYNGVNFTSTIQATAAQKSSNIISATTFYVRPDSTSVVNSSGIESQDGLANTVGEAFKTIQGAVNTIKAKYISMDTITVRVADGTYTSGAYITNSYIAAWNIVGNTSNPNNCIVDCTSTNAATYVPGTDAGSCFGIGGTGNLSFSGFYMRSYYGNVGCEGGYLLGTSCFYTASIIGSPCCSAASGGSFAINGTNNQFSGANACDAFIAAYNSGAAGMGGHDVYGNDYVTVTIVGNPTVNRGFVEALSSGTITIFDSVVSFPGGTPQGPRYYCSSGGGINFMDGNTNVFPGSQPGVVIPPGWV